MSRLFFHYYYFSFATHQTKKFSSATHYEFRMASGVQASFLILRGPAHVRNLQKIWKKYWENGSGNGRNGTKRCYA
jgi:hypothetical protein